MLKIECESKNELLSFYHNKLRNYKLQYKQTPRSVILYVFF